MRHLKIKTVEKKIESVERFGKWYEQQGGFWEVWCAQKHLVWCAQKHFSMVWPKTLQYGVPRNTFYVSKKWRKDFVRYGKVKCKP